MFRLRSPLFNGLEKYFNWWSLEQNSVSTSVTHQTILEQFAWELVVFSCILSLSTVSISIKLWTRCYLLTLPAILTDFIITTETFHMNNFWLRFVTQVLWFSKKAYEVTKIFLFLVFFAQAFFFSSISFFLGTELRSLFWYSAVFLHCFKKNKNQIISFLLVILTYVW